MMSNVFYYSIKSHASNVSLDPDHFGTSSTPTDVIELRVGDGTGYEPTRREVIEAMRRFERFIIAGGVHGAGANLPKPTGPF